jgi:hypothetical protein
MRVETRDTRPQAAPDAGIAALERELEQRRTALQRDQDAAERLRQERIQADQEEAARREAEEREQERLRAIADRARTQPLPSGLESLATMQEGAGEVDCRWLRDLFPLVLVAEGPLALPVITIAGGCVTVDGPTLQVRRSPSQLVLAAQATTYQAIYREAARAEFARLVEAERERAPSASVLYVATLPHVEVSPDPENRSLARVCAVWGEVFAYALPTIEE